MALIRLEWSRVGWCGVSRVEWMVNIGVGWIGFAFSGGERAGWGWWGIM